MRTSCRPCMRTISVFWGQTRPSLIAPGIPASHYSVANKAIRNGKHVYSEKPLAIKFSDGKKLIKLAKKKKLYVGNAPDTFLGGGLQKSRELLDKKVIGKVKFGKYKKSKSEQWTLSDSIIAIQSHMIKEK